MNSIEEGKYSNLNEFELYFFIVDVCTINSGRDQIDLKVLQHNLTLKKCTTWI